MIASGPAYPDSTTSEQAQAIAKKYDLHLSDLARDLLTRETPKDLPNAESRITGSVRQLWSVSSTCPATMPSAPEAFARIRAQSAR